MSYENKAIITIKSIMERQGVKQKVIANKCGYTEQKFSALMTGRKKLSLDDAVIISCALGVTLNDIIIIDDESA